MNVTQKNWGALIAMQARVMVIVYGIPGTGKTAVIRALAKMVDYRFIHCILSTKMQEDVGGIPQKTDVFIDGVIRECTSSVLSEEMVRAKYEKCVLFFDELNETGHGVLAAAQEWFNNPPPNCWMIAASNRPEHSTNGQPLSPPVINRMAAFDWERPTEERRKGWRNGFRDYPAPSVPILPEDFLANHGVFWGELMCQFEDRFPDLFGDDAYPKERDKATEPWAGDRSWTNVGRLMCAADASGCNEPTRKSMVHGCVGQAAASTFLTWVNEQDLPDPEALLNDPEKIALPARFDISRAIVSGIRGRVAAERTSERWEMGQDCIERIFPQHQELGLWMFASMQELRPSGHEPQIRNGVFSEITRLMTEIV